MLNSLIDFLGVPAYYAPVAVWAAFASWLLLLYLFCALIIALFNKR